MNDDNLLYRVEQGVAVITLNRPDRLNAWTPHMGAELAAAAAAAGADPAVRAIVLTGAGRGFCAGMDHANLALVDENRQRQRRTVLPPEVPAAARRADFEGLFNYFPALGKPVIAALNGAAAGSGLVLALSCDVRFADAGAVLTTAFARRGLVAEHGVAWLLARLAGLPGALDLLLSGRRIDAQEAHGMGLVNFVCEPGTALERALAYAGEIAANCSPRSLQIIKRQVWNAAFEDLHAATEQANHEMLRSFDAADFREAQAALAAKRAPQFAPITASHKE
jgi:enoyl-CoA hydratase/carnithine racemase